MCVRALSRTGSSSEQELEEDGYMNGASDTGRVNGAPPTEVRPFSVANVYIYIYIIIIYIYIYSSHCMQVTKSVLPFAERQIQWTR